MQYRIYFSQNIRRTCDADVVECSKAFFNEGGAYKFEAYVDGDSLEDVFQATQNLTREGWVANHPQHYVDWNARQNGLRSSMVGDIIQDNDGNTWIIDMFGFEQIQIGAGA